MKERPILQTVEDEKVYSSSQIFPDKAYDYNIGVGLDGFQRVIILTVRIYPVSYSPAQNTVYFIQDADVKVTYEQGSSPLAPTSNYDLVIITPRKFLLGVRPLMNHKIKNGVETKIVTTESIYREYKGRDNQEDIKLFTKNAIEKWNVTYVVLVGGRMGLGYKWAVPARYSNLEDKGGWNETYVTDLYFADIYKYNTTSMELEFDDWDSNGNDVFAGAAIVPEAILLERVHAYIEDCERLLGARAPLREAGADPAIQVATRAVQERLERERRRMLRLLELLLPADQVEAARRGLEAGDRAKRENALELLEGLLRRDLKAKIIPILEQIGDERGAGPPAIRRTLDQALRRLAAGPDRWLAACAAHAAARLGRTLDGAPAGRSGGERETIEVVTLMGFSSTASTARL